jgi:hypothetical protein
MQEGKGDHRLRLVQRNGKRRMVVYRTWWCAGQWQQMEVGGLDGYEGHSNIITNWCGNARTTINDSTSILHTTLRGSSPTIWRKKKTLKTRISTTTQNHLTSINSVIDHRDDGNVLITRELSDALLTKICWGILTPWRRGVPF